MDLEGKKVLIVDDEPEMTELMKIIFSRMNVETTQLANDGAEGLDLYRKYKPDLVMLDVLMPKMDGFQVAKAIRQTDKSTPIVMMSRQFSSEALVLARQVDAAVLPLPQTVDFIRDFVAKL